MKGAAVYHKVKGLRERYSLREVSRILEVSVNTVRKYERMELTAAGKYLSGVVRSSQYDVARDFIVNELESFPEIRATTLLRKVKAAYPEISGKARSFRYYISGLRQSSVKGDFRHYAPVLDMEPGIQLQVDIGEDHVRRNERGETFKAYFVSFVLSWSRHSFVTFRGRCYDTESFIAAHLEAFAFFGGIASEYVYDQTKLVVIEERYREVFFNERFHQFALKYGFRIRVCEGYDPQSKGKVERFIGYVKQDFLSAFYYEDIASVNVASKEWLSDVVNARIHRTTGRVPAEMFAEELPHLKPFENLEEALTTRLADKTGLLCYMGNRYSVPYEHQRSRVRVRETAEELIIHTLDGRTELARHPLAEGRGKIIKNNNHYRDYRASVAELSDQASEVFRGCPYSDELITRIKSDNPTIARDQLRALISLHKRFAETVWDAASETILTLPILKATVIESILTLYQTRLRAEKIDAGLSEVASETTSALDRSLDDYMEVIAHA